MPFILLLLIIPIVFAHFPEGHIGPLSNALNDPTWNSALKQKILAHPDECYAGILAIDSSVIFYLTEEGRDKKYGATHSIAWLNKCNQLAGNDEAKQVFCTCGGLHLVQDTTSHGYKDYQGYTGLCLMKYASTNIFLHSVCERSVINNYLDNLDQFQYSLPKDEIRLKTCDAYDLMVQGDEGIEGDEKCTNPYVQLLSESAGVDLCQAVHIVGSNLKLMCTENQESGSGYTDIYRSKIEAPTALKWVGLIGFFALIILILINQFLGRNWWKYIAIALMIPFLIASGLLIYYGWVNTQGFYHDYNFLMLDPLTKVIQVPDWQDRMHKTVSDTIGYFSDPDFEIPKSASGFDFYENNKLVSGTLNRAETTGSIIWGALMVFIIALFILIEYLTFRKKKNAV